MKPPRDPPISFWCDSKDLIEKFSKMIPPDFDAFELVENEPADYYVILSHPRDGIDTFIPEKSIIFQLEPLSFVKTWGAFAFPRTDLFLDVRDHDTYVNCLHWELAKTYEELMYEPPILKTKMVSCVTTSKYFDTGHIFRIDFLKYVESKGFRIDIFNYDNQFGFKGYCGQHPKDDKNIGMLPYKYYFHAENHYEYNFITEKIWDSVLAECVCFYVGCPNISDWVDPACYILLDPTNFEKSLNIIRESIRNKEWSKRIDKIREEKHRILKYFNVFEIIRATINRDRGKKLAIVVKDVQSLMKIKNTQLYTRCDEVYFKGAEELEEISWNRKIKTGEDIKEDVLLEVPSIDDQRKVPCGIESSNLEIYEEKIRKLNNKTPQDGPWMTVQHYKDIQKLKSIQSTLHIDFGSFSDEFPEQLMSVKFLKPDAKVMELGGNIGRNSSIISRILNDQRNLVVLESNPEIFKQLVHNRNKNGLNFNAECSALSIRPLVQHGWDTKAGEDTMETLDNGDGWFKVNIIKFNELKMKYKIDFNTFVVDCEGAFCQILKSFPACLTGIEIVIIENDFKTEEDYRFVSSELYKNGLRLAYSMPLVSEGSWVAGLPCRDYFYEVFTK
jgi:FkbM family methyltransferase